MNNAVEIPQFGFGVSDIAPDETAAAVKSAMEAGYRHVDTAQAYGNEEGVGQAVAESGLARGEVFVTTKLRNRAHGLSSAVDELEQSLRRLGLDYVDLYLIHWPLPYEDRYVETWQGFERVLADGRARAVGVSNFQVAHLDRLAHETEIVPAVNQIELHPRFSQPELRDYNARHGIATEAWSPLDQGASLSIQQIKGLAGKYGKTPAQIVLRWHIQLGNIVFPKSSNPKRIAENIDVFDFELTAGDVATIGGLNTDRRRGPHPDTLRAWWAPPGQ